MDRARARPASVDSDLPTFVLSPPDADAGADVSPDGSGVHEKSSDEGTQSASGQRARLRRHRNARKRRSVDVPPAPAPFDMASVSLPQSAPTTQVHAAHEKLERLERMRVQKRAWLRYSGVEAAIAAGELITVPDEPASRRQSLTPSDLAPEDAAPASAAPSSEEDMAHPPELLTDDWNDDEYDTASSASSSLGGTSDSSTDAAGAADTAAGAAGAPGAGLLSQLSLQHSKALTNKQMRKHLRRLRNVPPELCEMYQLDRTLLNRVSHGLTFARRSRRMSRAMVRYTPNASELSPRASVDPTESALLAVSTRTSAAESSGGSDTDASEQRLNVDARPRAWHRRRKKAWNAAPAPEAEMARVTARPAASDAASEPPPCGSTAATGIAEAAAAQAPPGTLVYDVLYENERGALLFGVLKQFSKYMLSALDPSPWSDADGANTALDPSTKQLPDPTWEWVHPEWLVDMTGETDEDGWQYSGSFTGLQMWNRTMHFSNAPARGRWMQHVYDYARARSERRGALERSKLHRREDAGLEALMRSMRIRTAHWRGVPSIWTFVRRRRWVRLRRKVEDACPALVTREAPRPSTDTEADAAAWDLSGSSDGGASDGGGDSSVERRDMRALRQIQHEVRVARAMHMVRALLPLFLLLPGQVHDLRRRRGHGDPLSPLWSHHYWLLVCSETSVHNPFVEYAWVQRCIARDDLAFLVHPLRALERRYQRELARDCDALGTWDAAPIVPLETTLGAARHAPHARDTPQWRPPIDTVRATPALLTHARGREGATLVRAAVAALNMMQLRLVMKACANDRLKLGVWAAWLGRTPADAPADTGADALQHEWTRHWRRIAEMKRVPAADVPAAVERTIRIRTYNHACMPAALLDVWDLCVVYLDEILGMFDHESTQRQLVAHLHALHAAEFTHIGNAGDVALAGAPATTTRVPSSDARLCAAGRSSGTLVLPRLPLLPRDV